MNIDDMLLNAIKNNDMIKFLCGEGEYMVETSQYAPEAELTDVGKVLSKGIYKLYRYNDNIEQKFEESLLKNIKLNTEFKVDLDLKKNKKTKETK